MRPLVWLITRDPREVNMKSCGRTANSFIGLVMSCCIISATVHNQIPVTDCRSCCTSLNLMCLNICPGFLLTLRNKELLNTWGSSMWLVYFVCEVDLEQNAQSLTESIWRYPENQSGLRYCMLIYCSKICDEMLSQSTYVVIFLMRMAGLLTMPLDKNVWENTLPVSPRIFYMSAFTFYS